MVALLNFERFVRLTGLGGLTNFTLNKKTQNKREMSVAMVIAPHFAKLL
jgi:hypothetical protein